MPITSSMRGAAARGDSASLLRVLETYDDAFDRLQAHLGVDLSSKSETAVLAAPPVGISWTVVGIDGKFQIRITNPLVGVDRTAGAMNLAPSGDFFSGDPRIGRQRELTQYQAGIQLKRIIHEFQSSSNVLFDNAGGVQSYGPSDVLSYDIQNPNQTLFWRIHSRFEGSSFSAWQYLQNPLLCGVAPVSSGAMRSSSQNPNTFGNSTNNATLDSISAGTGDPTTDATIRIYGSGGVGSAYSRLTGITNPSRPAGTLTLKASATKYYIVYDTSTGFYSATTSYPNTLPDLSEPVGQVTTVALGGGGGTGGGGGSGGGSGGGRQALT